MSRAAQCDVSDYTSIEQNYMSCIKYSFKDSIKKFIIARQTNMEGLCFINFYYLHKIEIELKIKFIMVSIGI